MSESLEFMPTWTAVWSVKKAEFELRGFKFQGEGWYKPEKHNDLMLVVKIPSDDDSPLYRFHIWNGFDPREIMQRILSLSTFQG